MPSVVERMREALNNHDLESFLECFDENYQSEQPTHPNRGFGGKEQVRKNWSSMFESFPDFEAQLLRHTADEGTVWSEWHWRATGLNMAGVVLMGGGGGPYRVGAAVHGAGRGRRREPRRSHEKHNRGRPA